MAFTKRVAAIFLLSGLISLGCSESGHKRINIDPKDMAPACAAYSACFGFHGTGHCIMSLDTLRHLDVEDMSLELAERTIMVDWVETISLAQNIKCVIEAGRDCEKILGCMNQGVKNLSCDRPLDNYAGHYCLDEGNLAVCMVTQGYFFSTVEFSVRCSSLGLKCVEMPLGGSEVWAACAIDDTEPMNGAKVTCAENVASIDVGGGVLRFDCDYRGGTCAPGSYSQVDMIWDRQFCLGPDCNGATFEDHCEGNDRTVCYSGEQVSVPCDKLGLACREVVSDQTGDTICSYPHCNSFEVDENCDNGTITYCGLEGEISLSCTELGFSSCELDSYGLLAACRY